MPRYICFPSASSCDIGAQSSDRMAQPRGSMAQSPDSVAQSCDSVAQSRDRVRMLLKNQIIFCLNFNMFNKRAVFAFAYSLLLHIPADRGGGVRHQNIRHLAQGMSKFYRFCVYMHFYYWKQWICVMYTVQCTSIYSRATLLLYIKLTQLAIDTEFFHSAFVKPCTM